MTSTHHHRPRYFQAPPSFTPRDPHKQLVASLTRLVTNHPPSSLPPTGGLYSGPLGVALLFHLLHPHYPTLLLESQSLAAWAAAYLRRTEEHMPSLRGPSLSCCGIRDDILVMLALGAASAQDAALAREFARYAAVACDPDAEDEWMNGRAGYLYLLRLVRTAFRAPPATPTDNADAEEGTSGPSAAERREVDALLTEAAEEVIEAMLARPRPWRWRGKAYVGAVHGAAGIIAQIALTAPGRAGAVVADMGAVLSYQFDGGNWPSSIPPGRDRLVQFCHGAPGVVTSLESVREHFPTLRERIDAAVRKGRQCVQERGLLTKEPCLCHGISGNAMALEGTEVERFLSYTTGHEMRGMERDGLMEGSGAPWSLFGGEAGRAWAWAVVDRGLERRVVGYNDI